ncbi:hypothetical protein NA57DRAFT_57471 [Rhizodiscina lignyota]|uniref:Uncharacterized protein n=1 Tax=Rhizodiscina lignyota TaxID=1504668 RepID=A0A9P4IFF4_9PEZI|nr:hypothetical protein NA57DRAFT_57471 [Rhizodiscina lignyota]
MQSSRWARQAEPAKAPSVEPEPEPAPTTSPSVTEPVSQDPEPQVQPSSFDGPYDDGTMDEFAQTRPPDDLFDDEFTPMPEPIVEAEPPAPPEPEPVRGVASGVRGGRGARRGGAGNTIPSAGRIQTQRSEEAPKADGQIATSTTPIAQDGEDAEGEKQIPQGPAKMRSEAVRGDRSGTGGVKKAKLTEEQLTARMQAMALKSSQLEAAHARAADDLAKFEAREAQAAVRRKEDRQNRQQMMGEREKNRQRKLQALGGREWDAEKKEEDYAPDRIRGASRGAHGGVAGSRYAQRDAEAHEDGEEQKNYFAPRGRGRGRGGRGRGRDNRDGPSSRAEKGPEQVPPAASDFPELPISKPREAEGDEKKPQTLEFPVKKSLASPGDIRSWADQVEGALSP